MKSEWRVTCNYIGGERFYGVYRLRDRKEVDHSGNRETPDEQFFAAIENLFGRKLNPQDKAEAEKIAQLLNAAPKDEISAVSGTLVSDAYSKEFDDAVIAQLRLQQKAVQHELSRIDACLSDNKRMRQYVAEMKLMVRLPDGTILPVTSDNIVGLNDSIDFLVSKRKIVSTKAEKIAQLLNAAPKE